MTTALDGAVRATLERLDGGFLQVYAGDVMLAQMRFSDPAFGEVVDGEALARPIMVGTGREDGMADQWVALAEDSTPILFGIVGDDMLINQRFIAKGAEVRVKSFTYRQER
jgi:hypothetical protein